MRGPRAAPASGGSGAISAAALGGGTEGSAALFLSLSSLPSSRAASAPLLLVIALTGEAAAGRMAVATDARLAPRFHRPRPLLPFIDQRLEILSSYMSNQVQMTDLSSTDPILAAATRTSSMLKANCNLRIRSDQIK